MSGADSLDFELLVGQEDNIAGQISRFWTQWKSARTSWENNVDENQRYVYATSTSETTNVQNPHDHTTHIGKIAQIFDNLTANYMSALFPHEDWLTFEGNDEESETFDKKQAVLSYIRTKNKLNGFRNVVNTLINDWSLTGNCFAGVTYKQESHADPETGEVTTGYVGPWVYRISPHDIVMNPVASDFEHSPKIIRSLKTLGELARDAEENPELGYSTEIIKRVEETRKALQKHTDSDIDRNIHLTFDGFGSPSLYFNSGFVEILEFYGDIYNTATGEWLKNHVITVVDKIWVLRQQPLNTWSGRPNIFHCGWRLRPDNLWAMGPLDNLVGMQYLINHLENGRADAFDQMLDSDRILTGDVEIEHRGAAIDYYVVEGGSVAILNPDMSVLNADFEIQRKEEQMEEFAGAPKEAMGIRTPGEKTLGEVNLLATAASRIFQHKTIYFEEQFLEKLVNAELEVSRRNLDATDIIKVIDDDLGVSEFMRVTKDDITANGTLVPIGARHFARQAQLASNLQQFAVALVQDPLMQQHFPSSRLGKTWEDLLGFKKLDLFEKFGRVEEELELERLRRVAQEQVEVESQVPLIEEEGVLPDERTATQGLNF